MPEIHFTLNGDHVAVTAPPALPAAKLLREDFDLTGTKTGCGEGECGACTILVDGEAVNSCLLPAARLDGAEVVTIEGLERPDGSLHPIQEAFVQAGGVQCGFCTPGMILSAEALLAANEDPTDEEIRDALVGNLCRCTGYVQIVDAVKAAAARLREGARA